MELEQQFIEYRDITLIIINEVKNENYDDLEEFFFKRQTILDNIIKDAHEKEQLNLICGKLNINKLEKTLEAEIKIRKEKLLDKIKESQKRRMVMSGYNNLQARAVFLSKEL